MRTLCRWLFVLLTLSCGASVARGATVVGSIPVGSAPGRIALTPDGDRLYVSNRDSDSVSVVAVGTESVIATIPVGDAPHGLAVTLDGSQVWVANRGAGTVSILDTATLTVVGTLTVGTLPVDVTFSHDGARAYVVHGAADVYVLDASSHVVLSFIPAAGVGQWFRVSADDSTGYLALTDLTSVEFRTDVIDLDTLTVVDQIPDAGVYRFSAFSPTAWGISDPDTVAFVNLVRAEVRKTFTVPLRPNDMALSPDGERLLTTHDTAHVLSIRHAVHGGLMQTLAMPGEPTGIAIRLDGSKAFVSQLDLGTLAVVSLP